MINLKKKQFAIVLVVIKTILSKIRYRLKILMIQLAEEEKKKSCESKKWR